MSRIARMLNTSAEVWREVRTPDGMGGWTSARAKIDAVRARFSQPSATERVVADSNGADLSHVVYLLPSAQVRRGDELRTPGRIFDVLATFEPSEPGTYLRADCKVRQTSQ
jgi:head-tail adaptor